MRDELKTKQDLRARTLAYSLRVVKLYEALPKHGAVHVITHQLLRSATSVGAHYRESCRAKSTADFISKIEGGLQELEESGYWIELLIAADFVPKNKLQPLCDETHELIAMLVVMVKNATLKKG